MAIVSRAQENPNTSIVRVLVVEDFERFRRVERLILQERFNLQIVGEVSDGLMAVVKAKELQTRPDPPRYWATNVGGNRSS